MDVDSISLLPADEVNRTKMLHFAVVVFEQMWLEHNKIILGGTKPDWNLFGQRMNHRFLQYWSAAISEIESKEENIL